MTIIENLTHDHQRIRLSLAILERWCHCCQTSLTLQAGNHLRQLVGFFQSCILNDHFKKEEALLFPELVKIGVSVDYGPISALLKEHQRMVAFIETVSYGSMDRKFHRPAALTSFCRQVRDFVQFMEQHLLKEENVIFEVARMHIPLNALQRLGIFIRQDIDKSGDTEAADSTLDNLKAIYLDETKHDRAEST